MARNCYWPRNPEQMTKLLTVLIICLVSCASSETNETKPVYDEATLKTFVLASKSTSDEELRRQTDSILTNTSTDSAVFRQTISFLETPFSNPNSSYRNQHLYEKILQAKLKSNWYNADEKNIAAERIKLLQQNNVGTLANDFTYITAAGYRRKMYEIKSDYLMLYFNNPDCEACKQMKASLMSSSIINDRIKSNKLKLLSIYPDTNEKLWLDHLKEFPQSWIQGRDENEFLYKNKVYDLRAIPTIYLLDADKKVLLKDCISLESIEALLK